MSEAQNRAPARKPSLGRAAFAIVAVLWVAVVILLGQNWPNHDIAAWWVFGVSVVTGVVLAILSLRRGERRTWAIVTLCLVGASPAVAMIGGLIALAVYGIGLST